MLRSSDDSGETLLEVIISLLVIGLAVAAVLGGVAAGSTLSAAHRTLTTADVTVKSRVEAVERLPYDPSATAGNSTYDATAASVPSGFTGDITAIRCVPAPAAASLDLADPAAAPECTGGNDQGLQILTLTVQAASGTATETVTFAKRRP